MSKTFDAVLEVMRQDPTYLWSINELSEATGLAGSGIHRTLNHPNSKLVFSKNEESKRYRLIDPNPAPIKKKQSITLDGKAIIEEGVLIGPGHLTLDTINEQFRNLALEPEQFEEAIQLLVPVIERLKAVINYLRSSK